MNLFDNLWNNAFCLGCHGWRFDLRGVRGFRILPFLHRSEAQSVLVRKGCVLYGYDISWRQGRVVVVNTNHEEGDMADVSSMYHYSFVD